MTPGESLCTQHRLVILDIGNRMWRRKLKQIAKSKTKWWNLNIKI